MESSHPGFSYDLVLGLVRKGDVKVNLNESLLRLQGSVTEQDSEWNTKLSQIVDDAGVTRREGQGGERLAEGKREKERDEHTLCPKRVGDLPRPW